MIGNADPKSPEFDPWPLWSLAMRRMLPEIPPEAVVYAADAGMPDRPNISLSAGVVKDGKVMGKTWTKSVSKDWLRDFCEALESAPQRKDTNAPPEILQ